MIKKLIALIFIVTAVVATGALQPQSASASDTQMAAGDIDMQTDCTQASHFLNVSADPANAQYASPELSVNCDGTNMIVSSNGIPSFEFISITPNGLQEQNYQFTVPLNPVALSEPVDIPLLGAVGVTVDGMPIFGPNEAPNMDYGDPYLDGILDFCNGHTARQGTYHYHARPDCLFENINGNAFLVIGYAFDGYPIMAPYACVDADCSEIVKVESGWARTSDVRNAWEAHEYIDGSSMLDECNGMVGADGDYRYYATDSFPYFMGCYHGQASTSSGFDIGAGGQGGGEGAPQGQGGQNGRPQGAPPRGQGGEGRPPRR